MEYFSRYLTEYFEGEVLRKRPYLKKEWCIAVVENPVRWEAQENNRYRFWAPVPELGGRFVRVITLADKATTIPNRPRSTSIFPSSLASKAWKSRMA